MRPIERAIVVSIKKLMQYFPCVVVLGARQVGKTTLLKQILPNVPIYDLEKTSDFERIGESLKAEHLTRS